VVLVGGNRWPVLTPPPTDPGHDAACSAGAITRAVLDRCVGLVAMAERLRPAPVLIGRSELASSQQEIAAACETAERLVATVSGLIAFCQPGLVPGLSESTAYLLGPTPRP